MASLRENVWSCTTQLNFYNISGGQVNKQKLENWEMLLNLPEIWNLFKTETNQRYFCDKIFAFVYRVDRNILLHL